MRCIVHSLRLLKMEELIGIERSDDLGKLRVCVSDPPQVQSRPGQHHAGKRRRYCAKRALIQCLQVIGDHLHTFELCLYYVDRLQSKEGLRPLCIVTDRVAQREGAIEHTLQFLCCPAFSHQVEWC